MIKFTAPEDRVVRSATSKVGERVGEKVGEKLSQTEETILSLLHEDPAYTYTSLAEKTGLSEKSIFVRLKSLKQKGIIERVGSDKRGHWKINKDEDRRE